MPLLALLNISVIVRVANALSIVLEIGSVRDDPIFASALYIIAFMLPYLWSIFVKKRIVLQYRKPLSEPKGTQEEFLKKY